MQKIQLYIEGQRVDMFKDESVSITQSIQNVKDPSKIFTDFSKTFNLPASKTNNKIFKHYYNFDIVGGFDARTKKDSNIELNNTPFRTGKIKLEGVDLKDNKPHTYKITFFGNTVTLKDTLGEDKLGNLAWLDNFVQPYSSADVKNILQNGKNITVGGTSYPNAITCPLISATTRLYYDSTSGHAHDELNTGNLRYDSVGTGHQHGVLWSDLKYSIRLDLIVKAIEEEYPSIQFSDDFFNQTNSAYYNLYMWMHRTKGVAKSSTTSAPLYSQIVNSFTPTTTFIPNINNNGTTVTNYAYGANTSSTVTVYNTSNDPYNVVVRLSGSVYQTEANKRLNYSFSLNNMPSGTWTITLESATTNTFSSVAWEFDSVQNQGDYNATITSSVVQINEIFSFFPTQQLPELKIIDFLTGIFKIWNLTAYVVDDIIKVDSLDAFYSTFETYDITKYVDVNSSAVNIALPYKQINFNYADYKTYLASVFNQLNNEEFGELEYKGEQSLTWVGSDYKIDLPFQKMMYERLSNQYNGLITDIQYGLMNDDNLEPYIGKPLIHYVNLRPNGSTPISFRDSETAHSQVTRYYIPLNSNGITGTDQSLHFNAEIDEYALTQNNETLFENYYKNYIQDVFNEKRRITKVSAYLPLRVLLKYNLSDRFVINSISYKINSITTNLETGKSELELLNEV
jgi:hypothetical protein